jgi:hypothetical protein
MYSQRTAWKTAKSNDTLGGGDRLTKEEAEKKKHRVHREKIITFFICRRCRGYWGITVYGA